MLDVVVDRETWLRGKPDEAALLTNKGKMCCLGFACKAAGYDDADIFMLGTISSTQSRREIAEELMFLTSPNDNVGLVNSMVHDQLTGTNDSYEYSEEERERNIIKLGLEVNINFSFVN